MAHRGRLRIILLVTVAAWWALWDFRRGSIPNLGPTISLSWSDTFWVKPLLFLGPPTAVIAVIQVFCYSLDRTFLGRGWTTIDVLRLACWRTVSPTVALLFVASGFDAIYDRSTASILWLVGASMVAIVGAVRLRQAEGLKLRKVKSGELYKRAFVMAKEMRIPLKRVYVVPAGRGHLTNAYGLGQSIAVTDNYGKFLNRPQLDFVIGHELAHVKERHGRKNLGITVAVYAVTALVCFFLPQILATLRPLFDILIVFVPILIFYFFSRRFEYAADRSSVQLTQDPETAIHALASLYRITEAPTHCDRLTELFMTHPALTRRAWAIGEAGGIPADRLSEVIDEMKSGRGAQRDQLHGRPRPSPGMADDPGR